MGRVAAVLRQSNPFSDFVKAFAPMASQAIDKRNETEAWNKFSDTFVPQQPMDAQEVQTPVSPLPGQISNGVSASNPALAQSNYTPRGNELGLAVPDTISTQVNMPSKDPYKQLEYQTGKEFATKLKALSALNPNERQFAMRQLYQEREQLLSNARYDKFSQDMEGIMAEYNPADPVASHKAKAKAIALGRRLKIDTGDVLKLFEEPKQNLQFSPDGTMFVNGKQASNQGQYAKPFAPRGGGGGGSGRPVNPNTHDPNSGLPLGTKEKWARTYENTGLIRDENLLAEYENYLGIYQADPESVEGMVAKKWLDANQRRVNIASDNRNQYWSVSSGGAYQAGQSDSPPAESPQAPPTETEEQRKQRLKAALGIQ